MPRHNNSIEKISLDHHHLQRHYLQHENNSYLSNIPTNEAKAVKAHNVNITESSFHLTNDNGMTVKEFPYYMTTSAVAK